MAAEYPNYYALLDIDASATREAIRRRYLKQMHQSRTHPDLGGDHHQAILLNEAYTVLRDPQRRAAYDEIYLRSIVRTGQQKEPDQHVKERRTTTRWPYAGMMLVLQSGSVGVGGQCRDLSTDGCSFRTLHPLKIGNALELVFQDDPGLTLTGRVKWQRRIPQRFGPPLFEGGVAFRGIHADRFAAFLNRLAVAPR